MGDAGDQEPAGVLIGDAQRHLDARPQPRRQHAGRDAELVHEREHLVDPDARGAVAAEVPRDVRVRVLAQELRRRLGRDEVDPQVEDVHEAATLL